MIITLAGTPASGKGTVGKLLGKKLGFPSYSTGQMWREEAQRRGMTVDDFAAWLATHLEEDKKFDDKQQEMGFTQDNFIIDARMAWFFIPHSIKVFLDVDIDVAAQRRFGQQNDPSRAEKSFASLADVKTELLNRTKADLSRYTALYGVSEYDKTKFDIVIDTTELTPEQVVDAVLGSIKKMGYELPKQTKKIVV